MGSVGFRVESVGFGVESVRSRANLLQEIVEHEGADEEDADEHVAHLPLCYRCYWHRFFLIRAR